MSDFTCPECEQDHTIADLELWEVYEEDGKETIIECQNCNAELVITSSVTGWSFEAEVNE